MIRIRLYIIQLTSLILIISLGIWILVRTNNISREHTETYASALISQVATSIETTALDIIQLARGFAYSNPIQNMISNDDDVLKMRKEYFNANSTYNFIKSTNKNVLDIAIQLNNGKTYMFGSMLSYPVRKEIFAKIEESELNNKKGVFVFCNDASIQRHVKRMAYVLPIYSITEKILVGHCILLTDLYINANNVSGMQEEKVIFSLIDNSNESFSVNEKIKNNMQTMSRVIPTTGWYLNMNYSGDFSVQQNREYLIFAYITMASVTLVILILSLLIHREITYPIKIMQNQLIDIAQDPKSHKRIIMPVKNELGSISSFINHMLERIYLEHQTNIINQRRLLETELELKIMQLKALQSQVNPHFLYNTLTAMRAMAYENNLPSIAKIATFMAELFRYSIKGDSYVLLDEEIEIVKKYMEIMNIRMDNKFDVELSIPETISQSYMVKMILQPIVENAVFHGLGVKHGKGHLKISARYIDETKYCIEVIDDGIGMTDDEVKILNDLVNNMNLDGEQTESRSIGLINIARKIKLLVGEQYGLKIESKVNSGTTVSLVLPYLEEIPDESINNSIYPNS